ncbi:hypothetical protein ANCCEY_00776 [Ancylostoma ceylanicum]|uniref:RING-type domain-containing protein n=1 Tax=Ancylostoma ceylanicum TaxID=53326 RepID=A0A0D6M9C4_9BILA|nr:hypothetical protein ANCCEY_00776 [Ancylostoma ceylanicum]
MVVEQFHVDPVGEEETLLSLPEKWFNKLPGQRGDISFVDALEAWAKRSGTVNLHYASSAWMMERMLMKHALMVPEVLTIENPSSLGKQLFDTDIKQLNEAYARGRKLSDDYDLCCLCMDRVDRQIKMQSVVQIACCGLRFYHYDCMKNATLVRGQEMRCPTCNRPNEETFFEEAIKRQGIYFQTYNPSCEPDEESSAGNSRSRCYYAMTRTSAKERKCLSSLGPDKYDDSDALNDQTCGVHCHRVCAGPPWSTYNPEDDGDEEKWQCDDCREPCSSVENAPTAKVSHSVRRRTAVPTAGRRARVRSSMNNIVKGSSDPYQDENRMHKKRAREEATQVLASGPPKKQAAYGRSSTCKIASYRLASALKLGAFGRLTHLLYPSARHSMYNRPIRYDSPMNELLAVADIIALLMFCCGIVEMEFLIRTRNLPKLEEPHAIPGPALIGAVALTIGIVLGYLYFIIFNYAFQNCDKLVDAIYTSELWLESCYDILMAAFSGLSLVYILQRRYYGAINSNLDKIGRLFINITFSVVWVKVVVYKGYLSHQELCQRKELESYWCPVMRRNYECTPSDDLHGTQKMWYYINKGILSSSIISCASEFFPVLLVAHWLACGGAEEKAEDIERRRQLRQGVRALMKEFLKDISRVYTATTDMNVPPLKISSHLVLLLWILTPLASLACAIRWLVYAFTWYLTDERLDAHHKAHARGDISILFGCCLVLFVKLILQSVEVEFQRKDGFVTLGDAIIATICYVAVQASQWLQYFSVRRILAMSDRDCRATKKFLPFAALGDVTETRRVAERVGLELDAVDEK